MECQLQLVQTTARHVCSFLEQAMKLQCNGCLVNHPSQLQHECLMLSGEDRVRFCLEQALLLVNWGQVKTDFDQKWAHTRFRDKVWYQTLWTDDSWYEQLLSALLTQQHSPDTWITININTSISTFTFPRGLTMNRLYMAYHIPNQQCVHLQIRIVSFIMFWVSLVKSFSIMNHPTLYWEGGWYVLLLWIEVNFLPAVNSVWW